MRQTVTILFGFLAFSSQGVQADNVAVMVFSSNPKLAPYVRTAQTRMEQLLSDNDLTVLDQGKAKELQKSWKALSDPTYLVTAEDLVARADKYKIKGLYRVYLTGGVVPGLGGYFSATAHVDLRYIDAGAKVSSVESPAMGVRGFPPSDGLTVSAAQVNAVQRAVDFAAEKIGLRVMDTTSPRAMALRLTEVSGPLEGTELGSNALQVSDPQFDKLAKLIEQSWNFEEPTCRAKSPDGKMAIVGTYITETSRRNMSRSYGARLHVLDLEHQKEVLSFTLHEVGKRGDGENGPSKVLDCLFVVNWRFIAAATGNKISFFDTERGLLLSEFVFQEGPESLKIHHLRLGTDDYLQLVGDKLKKLFLISAQK